MREEAERRRIVKEKKKKKRMLEYFQQLWNKVLEEEAALLESIEGFQIMEFKCKEVTTGDEERQQPSKKAKGKQQEKYCRGTIVKIGGTNPCERYVSTGQDCLVHHLK